MAILALLAGGERGGGEPISTKGPLARYFLAFLLRLRGNKTPWTCGVQALLSGLQIFCAIAHFFK